MDEPPDISAFEENLKEVDSLLNRLWNGDKDEMTTIDTKNWSIELNSQLHQLASITSLLQSSLETMEYPEMIDYLVNEEIKNYNKIQLLEKNQKLMNNKIQLLEKSITDTISRLMHDIRENTRLKTGIGGGTRKLYKKTKPMKNKFIK